MLTKEEHEAILKKIAETGDTAEMLDEMQKLRDDFDERAAITTAAVADDSEDRETPPGSEPEKIEEDGKPTAQEEKPTGDTVSRTEYEELKRKYIERFFSDPLTNPAAEKPKDAYDAPKDGEMRKYADLFSDGKED